MAEAEQVETDLSTVIGDEMAVRDALLELRALDAERERLNTLAVQIVDRYHGKAEKLRARAELIRQSVQNYITERNGGEKVAFPDVGTAYLTTRKAKLDVTDAVELEAWLYEQGHDALIVEKRTFDAKKTLELLIDEQGWRVAKAGLIVDADGEIVEAVPGVEGKPEGKTLAVRSA